MEVNRCLNCMEETEDAVCPKCGFNYYKIYEQPPMVLKPNTVLYGRYLVGKMIGQGGFGMTYIGFDLLLNIKVCIKEYYPMGNVSRDSSVSNIIQWNFTTNQEEQWKEGCESFLKEARKMAKLDSISGIVRVRDTFYENQTAYIIMDFIEGKTLKQYLFETGTMDYGTCINMLAPMMNSLSKVHGQGLIHRDISPDNMMVTKEGSLMLLDLGAAKDVSNGREGMSQLVTKRGFSPAEQYMESGSVGPWTDVYAFCATIYYCMYGKLIPEAMERLMQDTLSFPTLPNGSELPEDIKATLTDGMAVHTENRIQSMDELFARLSPYVTKPNQDMLSTLQAYSKTANTQRKKDKKNKRKKLAKVLIPVFSVLILAAAAILIFLFKPWLPKVEKLGNSNSNILNDGGLLIKTKEYEYFLDHNKNLRMCTYDGYNGCFYVDSSVIVAENTMYINQGKNKIYFMQDDGTDSVKIYSMDFDGSNLSVLAEGLNTSMLMQYALLSNGKEYLYYITMNDNQTHPVLNRCDAKTGKIETVINEDMCWYNLDGKYIYYTIFDDNNKTYLKRAALDGKHSKTLNNDKYFFYGFIENDSIFIYSLSDKAMYVLDMKGNKKTILYDAPMDTRSFTFAYGDGWIYYMNEKEGGVYRIREDGTANACLIEEKTFISICFDSDELWLQECRYDADGNSTNLQSFLCYKDGTTVIPIDESEILKTEDGLLYRTSDDGETYIICGYEGDEDIVGIPYEIDGVSVSNIDTDSLPSDKKYLVYTYDDDFEYKKTDDGTGIIITKYKGDVCNFIIQDSIEGLPIVEIGEDAFEASDVETVAIPSTVKKIDRDGFYNCKKLEKIYLSEGLEEIGQDAFNSTALTEIDLPDSLIKLGSGCFAYTKIKKVSIPKNVNSIHSLAFAYSEIEEYDVDRANDTFASSEGIIYLKDMKTLCMCPSAKSGSVVISADVTTIGGGAFICCNNITEISLEEGSQLNEIGCAFCYCTGLTRLDLSKSGNSIASEALVGCSSLSEIYFPKDLKTISADLFGDDGVPSSVKVVKYNAECDCQIEWPESVEVQTYE